MDFDFDKWALEPDNNEKLSGPGYCYQILYAPDVVGKATTKFGIAPVWADLKSFGGFRNNSLFTWRIMSNGLVHVETNTCGMRAEDLNIPDHFRVGYDVSSMSWNVVLSLLWFVAIFLLWNEYCNCALVLIFGIGRTIVRQHWEEKVICKPVDERTLKYNAAIRAKKKVPEVVVPPVAVIKKTIVRPVPVVEKVPEPVLVAAVVRPDDDPYYIQMAKVREDDLARKVVLMQKQNKVLEGGEKEQQKRKTFGSRSGKQSKNPVVTDHELAKKRSNDLVKAKAKVAKAKSSSSSVVSKKIGTDKSEMVKAVVTPKKMLNFLLSPRSEKVAIDASGEKLEATFEAVVDLLSDIDINQTPKPKSAPQIDSGSSEKSVEIPKVASVAVPPVVNSPADVAIISLPTVPAWGSAKQVVTDVTKVMKFKTPSPGWEGVVTEETFVNDEGVVVKSTTPGIFDKKKKAEKQVGGIRKSARNRPIVVVAALLAGTQGAKAITVKRIFKEVNYTTVNVDAKIWAEDILKGTDYTASSDLCVEDVELRQQGFNLLDDEVFTSEQFEGIYKAVCPYLLKLKPEELKTEMRRVELSTAQDLQYVNEDVVISTYRALKNVAMSGGKFGSAVLETVGSELRVNSVPIRGEVKGVVSTFKTYYSNAQELAKDSLTGVANFVINDVTGVHESGKGMKPMTKAFDLVTNSLSAMEQEGQNLVELWPGAAEPVAYFTSGAKEFWLGAVKETKGGFSSLKVKPKVEFLVSGKFNDHLCGEAFEGFLNSIKVTGQSIVDVSTVSENYLVRAVVQYPTFEDVLSVAGVEWNLSLKCYDPLSEPIWKSDVCEAQSDWEVPCWVTGKYVHSHGKWSMIDVIIKSDVLPMADSVLGDTTEIYDWTKDKTRQLSSRLLKDGTKVWNSIESKVGNTDLFNPETGIDDGFFITLQKFRNDYFGFVRNVRKVYVDESLAATGFTRFGSRFTDWLFRDDRSWFDYQVINPLWTTKQNWFGQEQVTYSPAIMLMLLLWILFAVGKMISAGAADDLEEF